MMVLASALAVSCIGIGIWAKYYELPWLYYQNLPFPTMMPQVYPGDVAPLQVERCNSSGEKKLYNTTHNLRNEKTGLSEMLPDRRIDIDPGCHRTISKINTVPLTTKPGIYTVWGTGVIQMRIGEREVPWYSEKFEVLPAKPPLLGIPGPPGADGADGAAGKQGKTGATGNTGATGATGAKGTFWGSK